MMDKTYREPAPPKITPGKIIHITTSRGKLYGLDENGVVWYSYGISENAYAPWTLAIGSHTTHLTPPTPCLL